MRGECTGASVKAEPRRRGGGGGGRKEEKEREEEKERVKRKKQNLTQGVRKNGSEKKVFLGWFFLALASGH